MRHGDVELRAIAPLLAFFLALLLAPVPSSAQPAAAATTIHLPSFPAAGIIETASASHHLGGLAATPPDLECGSGEDAWPCGRAARAALQRFVRRRAVECTVSSGEAAADADDGPAETASCTVAGSDIAAWLVSRGWARAAGDRYLEEEAEAREAELGIWSPVRPRPLEAAASVALPEHLAEAVVVAEVTLSTQTMTLIHDGEVIGHWPVSTARYGKVTPTGAWRAQFLSRHHRSSLYDGAPMPWSVFFNGDYAVHGTYETGRLGQPASAGCVRLSPDHAKLLFELAQAEGLERTVVVIRD